MSSSSSHGIADKKPSKKVSNSKDDSVDIANVAPPSFDEPLETTAPYGARTPMIPSVSSVGVEPPGSDLENPFTSALNPSPSDRHVKPRHPSTRTNVRRSVKQEGRQKGLVGDYPQFSRHHHHEPTTFDDHPLDAPLSPPLYNECFGENASSHASTHPNVGHSAEPSDRQKGSEGDYSQFLKHRHASPNFCDHSSNAPLSLPLYNECFGENALCHAHKMQHTDDHSSFETKRATNEHQENIHAQKKGAQSINADGTVLPKGPEILFDNEPMVDSTAISESEQTKTSGNQSSTATIDKIGAYDSTPGACFVQVPNRAGHNISCHDGTAAMNTTPEHPELIEAKLVSPEDDNDPPPVTVTAIATKLWCGINFQDRRVKAIVALAVILIASLGAILGRLISNGKRGSTAAVPTPSPTISAAPTAMLWTQVGDDITGSTEDFGVTVSLSSNGSSVAIGAPHGQNLGDPGKAFAFKLLGSWSSVGSVSGLPNTGIVKDQQSGRSLCLSGNGTRLAIGSPHSNYTNETKGVGVGHAQVFEFDLDSKTWAQLGQDLRGMRGDESYYGRSLSLSKDGSTVAIAADADVEVLEYNEANGQWDLIWNASNLVFNGRRLHFYFGDFGTSVSLSRDGQYIAIVTYGDESYTGEMRAYRRDASSWSQFGNLVLSTDYPSGTYVRFGSSISMSSDGMTVAIGGYRTATNATPGFLYMFRYDGNTEQWMPSGTLTGYIPKFIFASVSLSGNGNRVATQCQNCTVRVYQYNSDDGNWYQLLNDMGTSGTGVFFDSHTIDLSEDGSHIAVSLPEEGTVRMYNLEAV